MTRTPAAADAISGAYARTQPADPADASGAMEAEIARLTEALSDATANLVGAASAYRQYAARHRSVGRAETDPFFTTRAKDFERAADRASAALRARLKEQST